MNKKLFISLLFLLQSMMLVAQNYVYSVTTGTAWSREIYPKIERETKTAMKDGQLLEGAPNFSRVFNQIIYANNRTNTYNDSIFADLPHQEWIDMFKRRAVKFSQFYADNNQVLSQIEDYFSHSDVPEAAYDSLYFWTQNMYHRNINDIFLYEKLMGILMPHYESQQDLEHLIFCYMCTGLYNYQCARMGDKEASLRSELYYHKVMNLSKYFAGFTEPLNRYYFISAYVNLAVLHTQAGNISLSESVELTKHVAKIYSTPEVKEIFAQDSLLNEFAEWSLDLFRLRGISTYISHGLNNPWLRNELYAEYVEFKKKFNYDFEHLKNRYYAKLQYEDCLIEAFMGNISWDEAYKQMENMLQTDPEMLMTGNQPPAMKINYLNNLTETSIAIIEHSSMPREKKAEVVKMSLRGMLNIISRYEHSRYPFEKGFILENITRKAEILQYLNREERIDLLFRLIVLEQPTTYVHVSMVAALAKELASELIDKKPEFFLSMPNITSTKDVTQYKDSLINFIEQAAIYHDLGKISMPTVVNNCTRRLTDHEFDVLALHPEKSRPYFAIDPSLRHYQDVALGHHKWYDGDGYPSTFKNRQSPYFPIICLVTICDCLDAATENIGRNYHKPKPFEEVLSEFVKESGTRYHPEIISFILENKNLQNRMKQIVDVGRYDHYYKMYNVYMKSK